MNQKNFSFQSQRYEASCAKRQGWLLFWLLSTCFLIWLMVMLGGATRLTHAGLSIVEWRPITGIIPPLSKAGWLMEFQKYKQFPEFRQLNFAMNLADFKFIYGMEYAHRLLGRVIGLWFALPLVFFWVCGWMPPFLKRRSLLALSIGLLQGIMGWYMVKSGLIKDPQVSHYRLAAHLLLAVGLHGLLLWTAFQLAWPGRWRWQRGPVITCILVLFTLTYGALVAGLKAGLVYNTFPLMNGLWLPEDGLFLTPVWWNFVENPAMVQFIHRWLGVATLGAIIYYRQWPLAALACLQVALGIATLLYQVPVVLGTLHQGLAVIVFSAALVLVYLSGCNDYRPNIK